MGLNGEFLWGQNGQFGLPSIKLSTYSRHQHSKDLNFCLRICCLLFKKKNIKKTLWRKLEQSCVPYTYPMVFNNVYSLLWRLEVRHHNHNSASSSKGLTQPLRRKSSWGYILGDLNSKWGSPTLHTLIHKRLGAMTTSHSLGLWGYTPKSNPGLQILYYTAQLQGHTHESFLYCSDLCLFVSLPLLIGTGWKK